VAQANIKTGSAAFIDVVDATVIRDIYSGITRNKGVPPIVQFRPEAKAIALVFNDKGEVLIGVAESLAGLQAVSKAGGGFLVTAKRPVGSTDGGKPGDPPPPNALCPCGP
jgi:hypothetical protein